MELMKDTHMRKITQMTSLISYLSAVVEVYIFGVTVGVF